MKALLQIILVCVLTNFVFAKADTNRIKELIKISNEKTLSGDFENGIITAQQAIELSERSLYMKGLADGFYLKGFCESRTNQLDIAEKDLIKAAGYYVYLKNTKGRYRAVDVISDIYYWKGNAVYAQLLSKINGDDLYFRRPSSIFFFSLYLGALLFCMVYNIFLFRFTKDKAYKEMAKCIAAFTVFIYTTNNEFAIQFNTNLLDFTLMDALKNISILFATYYFANFLEELLSDKKEIIAKYFRFLRRFKRVIIGWGIISGLYIVLVIATSTGDPFKYFKGFLLWFIVNDLFGLILTLLQFTMLFIYSFKKDVRINYLVWGFVINVFFLSLAAAQAIADSRFTHIPYPQALGSVFFLIFMTVAITDKINLYRKEKEEAQSNALKHLEGLVAERTRDIKHQKELIEEKQTQILDSINYAKRLQNAILTTDRTMQAIFKESFVMYKPKDIVSGDFYWMLHIEDQSKNKNIFIMAAADCTGHGVPGAFMSMLNSTLLNQTAYNPNINTPSDALNFLNVELPKNLRSINENENINDGMDIAFCLLDLNRNIMKYAGANNPCWIIRNNELIELKPLKQAITAATDSQKKTFVDQEIALQKNDSIYLFTDGYADQFGGPNGKKFKYKTLGQLLLKIHNDPCEKQKQILEKTFMDWKGNLEQVDDVCIIGIRF